MLNFNSWKIRSLEKGQLRYLVREFLELTKLLDSSKKIEVQQKAKLFLKKLDIGLAKEERVEYKLAKNFERLRKAVIRARYSFSLQEDTQISHLLQQASYYDGVLKKIAARGGDLEKALQKLAESTSLSNEEYTLNLKEVRTFLQEAITADQAFVAAVENLLDLARTHKVLRSEFFVQEALPNLALANAGKILVLFDYNAYARIYPQESKDNRKLYGNYPQQRLGKFRRTGLLKRNSLYTSQITAERPPDGSGGLMDIPHLLNKTEDRLMKQSIIGYVELKPTFKYDQFLNAWEIYRIATKKGYGVFLTEIALCYAAQFHKALVMDRDQVSKAARKAWAYLDLNRPDVLKFPASLHKYHDLLGYSEEEIYAKFGDSGLRSVTFNRWGYPRDCITEKMDSLLAGLRKAWGWLPEMHLSWMDNLKETNQFNGGIASLDKAYYYDGKKKTLQELLARGKRIGYYGGQDKISRSYLMSNWSDLYHAGYAFFQSFETEAQK